MTVEVDVDDLDEHILVDRNDLLGQFEFGSTVILACTPDVATLAPLEVGATVRMGQALGTLG